MPKNIYSLPVLNHNSMFNNCLTHVSRSVNLLFMTSHYTKRHSCYSLLYASDWPNGFLTRIALSNQSKVNTHNLGSSLDDWACHLERKIHVMHVTWIWMWSMWIDFVTVALTNVSDRDYKCLWLWLSIWLICDRRLSHAPVWQTLPPPVINNN